jgi:MFS family permease
MSLRPSGLDALRHRNFRNYLFSRLLATIAAQMQGVAIGWQVYQITGSFTDLGYIGLAQFIPFVLLVLLAGQVADRHDRRIIINLCMVAQLIGSAILLVFTHSGLQAIWPVFLVLALLGSARAFAMPATKAVLINLVPVESFGSATAISSSTFQVATIAGPVMGGFLYLVGPQAVYAVSLALLLIASLLMLRVHTRQERTENPAPLSWQSAMEGLRFVKSRPVVLGAISLDLFAVLFGGSVAMLPAYARDVLHVGPEALGFLRTAPAAGAVFTASALAFYPIQRHVGRWMFGGVILFGMATIVFGISRDFWLSLSMLFLLGAGDMISVYIRQILIQFETPDALRGRVSAVSAMFIGASNELGEFESGMTAAWFGLIPSVVVGGAATLLVAAGWSALFPALRDADRFQTTEDKIKARSH